ncbi:nitroreductase family protein [Chloroflexota bacterium]
METLDAIKKRASLKSRLSSREVEPEKINTILEAARLAPSARNMQPWRFIVLKDKAIIDKAVKAAFGQGNAPMGQAPVIIIACADPDDDVIRDGKEYYLHDVACAMQNLVLAATDLGLATHMAAGIDEAELKKVLGIPEKVRFVLATPVAYPSEGSYDEASRERLGERTRKEMKEITFLNGWGQPF